MCRKTSHKGKVTTWLNREFSLELRGIKDNLSSLEGEITWEDYKDVVRSCQEKIKN